MQKSILFCLILFFSYKVYAQHDTVRISVKANVTKDGVIQLRWTANSPAAWRFTNSHGVTIERYTIMKNGKILDVPVKIALTKLPLKPPVLNEWKDIALKDQKAAIIAQALYGKDFDMSGGRPGIGEMIAMSQEQEQRYAMAMFAADQSYPAALFAEWAFEDKNAIKGEKYLYRVLPVRKDARKLLEAGSVYMGTDDYQELPKPLELNGIFGNKSVLITWNYTLLQTAYNTYNVERSTDGKNFQQLNKNPLLNFTGGDRLFYTDTIENSRKYYYRVIGSTPFGEQGPFSDTISGEGKNKLDYIPHITKVTRDRNGVYVDWEFSELGNKEISGFELQRSETANGTYTIVTHNISPESRTVLYSAPQPENYLRIAAIPKEGEPTYSYPFLFQQPDSIPPGVPKGLTGIIDSLGVVHLRWDANTESDLLGYRIFRGQIRNEDLIPLNDMANKSNSFTDTISLKTLNTKVYYAIASIDKRYNQSAPCFPVELKRPLLTKPASPYITNCEAVDEGVKLTWEAGNDESLTSFSIWRGENDEKNMKLLKLIKSPKENSFWDKSAMPDVRYTYYVISSNGYKDSAPSPAVFIVKRGKANPNAIKELKGERTDKGILLKWKLLSTDFKSVEIYRKEQGAAFTLWKMPELYIKEILDDTSKRNTTYEYLIVVKDSHGRPIQAQTKVD
ncbi:MAG: hypothetical protein H6Q14_512 [Bacteroidetes bacterium]|nr:hypothetical protein [Bacteroidota bacterium]